MKNNLSDVVLAITTGEPAGIGPEISLRAAIESRQSRPSLRLVLIGDQDFLQAQVKTLDLPITLIAYAPQQNRSAMQLEVLHVPLAAQVQPGQLDVRNAPAVLKMLDAAIAGALAQQFNAVVTAPLQKNTLAQIQPSFTGHTEYFAQKTNTPHVVMMLAGSTPLGVLRVALATTHLPLRRVPDAITTPLLVQTLTILARSLREQFAIAAPRILVTGLNPHAGENGYLGREEIEVITPAIKLARDQGIDALGPLSADTLFQERHLQTCDVVLAMYHDQGLPVLKYASFGRGVNITLGLPIIRTSVDHGTALDLAASRRADHRSMLAALEMALSMTL